MFYSPRVALCIVLLCQESTKPSLSLLFCCGRFRCLAMWSSDIKESWRTKPSCSLAVCLQPVSECNVLITTRPVDQITNKQTNKQILGLSIFHGLDMGFLGWRGLRSKVYKVSRWDSWLCPVAIGWLNKNEGLVPRPLVSEYLISRSCNYRDGSLD